MLPRKLYDFNVIIDGFPMAGLAEEITLPKLTRKMEELWNSGMAGAVKMDMGIEAGELEFTLTQFDREVLTRYGVTAVDGVNVRFLGAARADSGSGTVEAIEIQARGRWEEIDFGSAKKGDKTAMKVKMPLAYYKYSSDGRSLIEIDWVNGKEVVGGIDRTAEIRRAIGLVS